MGFLKKIWFNESHIPTAEVYSITIESEHTTEEYKMLHAHELKVPENPTPERPLRHTINIGPFDEDDINRMAQFFDTIRTDTA